MTLLYKIKRLVKADAHAMVEGLEEPKWILAQAIRDMEDELNKQALQITEKKARFDRLQKQIIKKEKLIQDVDEDIDLAVDEKREDIAKSLIKKLIINKRAASVQLEQSEQLGKEITGIERDFIKKKQSFDDICARSENADFSRPEDEVFDEAGQLIRQDNSMEHDVELEFIKRIKRRAGGKNEK